MATSFVHLSMWIVVPFLLLGSMARGEESITGDYAKKYANHYLWLKQRANPAQPTYQVPARDHRLDRTQTSSRRHPRTQLVRARKSEKKFASAKKNTQRVRGLASKAASSKPLPPQRALASDSSRTDGKVTYTLNPALLQAWEATVIQLKTIAQVLGQWWDQKWSAWTHIAAIR